jgi:hypothetical protein
MRTVNGWMHSNFFDIALGRADKFVCEYHPYHFKPMPFHEAAEYTARTIVTNNNRPLYIGLSGGPDSEYVTRLFCKLHIPFTPIIISTEINQADVTYATEICNELNITPIIVHATEQDIIDYYFRVIYPCRNEGITHVFQMLVVEKAKELNGVPILGETHVFDPDPMKSIVKAFKFLPDIISPQVIPFYYYTLELTYAEIKEIRPHETSQEFKARVRGTKYRPQKILPKYKINQSYHEAVKKLKPEWLRCDMGSPQEFVKLMESYIK